MPHTAGTRTTERSATSGFGLLGDVLGGGIDREGARLEGLLLGGKTQDALAKAKIRRDEAEQRLLLEENLGKFGFQGETAAGGAGIARAGQGNIQQLATALGLLSEQRTRARIADPLQTPTISDVTRQSISIGPGGPIKPLQFGPGGELATDILGPEAGDIDVTPTGEAQISLDEQRALLQEAKRLNPELFRSGGTTINLGGETLSESLLPGGEGTSIVPESIVAEEAFGAEAFVKGGINALSDFIGLGTPFVPEAQANEVLGNLSARTQIVLRADVPGGRVPVVVQELLARYAEDPRSLFRGDAIAVQRLTSTTAALKQALKRTQDKLDSPTKKTPTRQGELEDALFSIADLVADYEKILESIKNTGGEPAAGVTDEETVEVPAGVTVTKIGT